MVVRDRPIWSYRYRYRLSSLDSKPNRYRLSCLDSYQTDTDTDYPVWIYIKPILIPIYLFETDISVWYRYISVYTDIIPLYQFETDINIDFRIHIKLIPILSLEFISNRYRYSFFKPIPIHSIGVSVLVSVLVIPISVEL